MILAIVLSLLFLVIAPVLVYQWMTRMLESPEQRKARILRDLNRRK